MNVGLDQASATPPIQEPYSPRLRTALVLTGTGTSGAYHAGVLRALHEAGVKIDVVAGRGIGAVGALFAAIDGAQHLWDETGFWRQPAVNALYRWRATIRVMAGALGVSVAVVAVPLVAVALGLLVFPLDFLLRIIGAGGATGPVDWYTDLAKQAAAPEAMPTWLPRLVLLVLGLGAAVAGAVGLGHSRGRGRGAFWWRLIQPPLGSQAAVTHCWRVMWNLVRGAAQLKQPPAAELGRRYTEVLADNLGQPGFHELLIVVHDLDARRDLVFALVAEARRHLLGWHPATGAGDPRGAELFDLAGPARDHLADAVAAALAIPLATDCQSITFSPDGYWRGERHRLCDRPSSLVRVLDELAELGVEQLLIVSAAPPSPGPHAMSAERLDGRARLGEYLQSSDRAAVRDALRTIAPRIARVFPIQPAHNPIGPFDFRGGYDERSNRRQPLDELINRGYEDAYRQFIDPVVGASGERVGQSVR